MSESVATGAVVVTSAEGASLVAAEGALLASVVATAEGEAEPESAGGLVGTGEAVPSVPCVGDSVRSSAMEISTASKVKELQ
mmetsp:Transcript_90587/g.242635  ORF Transcript_90587/g.242635 Transcript_90587/m.242635 type:complete len:82 (-) Transcript_90587:325-570(-)